MLAVLCSWTATISFNWDGKFHVGDLYQPMPLFEIVWLAHLVGLVISCSTKMGKHFIDGTELNENILFIYANHKNNNLIT